jgi:CheY-like chemotaxis protein
METCNTALSTQVALTPRAPVKIIPVKLLNLRAALVIADDCRLRKSIVQQLKHEGWIVHGITKVEEALPILPHIPYQLIIVDCELPGIDGKDFVHLLHDTGAWRVIRLVALTNCVGAPLAPGLAQMGAFPASKDAWPDVLSHFLSHLSVKTGRV